MDVPCVREDQKVMPDHSCDHMDKAECNSAGGLKIQSLCEIITR